MSEEILVGVGAVALGVGLYLAFGSLLKLFPDVLATLCTFGRFRVGSMPLRAWLHQSGTRQQRDSGFRLKSEVVSNGPLPWPRGNTLLSTMKIGAQRALYRFPGTGVPSEGVLVTARVRGDEVEFSAARFRLPTLIIPMVCLVGVTVLVAATVTAGDPVWYALPSVLGVVFAGVIAMAAWGMFRAEVPFLLADMFSLRAERLGAALQGRAVPGRSGVASWPAPAEEVLPAAVERAG